MVLEPQSSLFYDNFISGIDNISIDIGMLFSAKTTHAGDDGFTRRKYCRSRERQWYYAVTLVSLAL
jgi:hypothetical protein